ncbi:MAG: winged helix-turn-helix domain-containing protein [Desulfomonilia bacterium]
MEFAYKIWIEKDGNTVFGMGIYKLLDLVAETGSLHKAAQELGMSYRAAWGKVREYEDRLGIGPAGKRETRANRRKPDP